MLILRGYNKIIVKVDIDNIYLKRSFKNTKYVNKNILTILRKLINEKIVSV